MQQQQQTIKEDTQQQLQPLLMPLRATTPEHNSTTNNDTPVAVDTTKEVVGEVEVVAASHPMTTKTVVPEAGVERSNGRVIGCEGEGAGVNGTTHYANGQQTW